MTRRHIHEAVKEQLVVMAGHLKSSDISRVTGISHRTVNRVIKLKRDTGSVVACNPLVTGRPRLLNGLDIAVSPNQASGYLSLNGSSILNSL